MKKYLIPLFLVFFVACSTQKKDGYKISGEIIGKTPALAYLKTVDEGKDVVIDSSGFKNGKFTFEGVVELPEMYYIAIGDEKTNRFFVENAEIFVKANIDSLSKATIDGSKTQDQYLAYLTAANAFDMELMKTYNQMKSTEDEALGKSLVMKLDSLYNAKTAFTKTYVKANTSSVVAPFLISRSLIYYLELEELEEYVNLLDTQLSSSVYTKALVKRVELLRNLQPGMPAPEFTQNNTKGEAVSLSDFKGKYLLIDFWASWCGPCRRANPEVLRVYNKYKGKNFTILGISMDENKEAWLKAIEDDKLEWEQVSTLEGWKNPVGKLYAVNGIPHAVLIDAEGNIVKRGIQAEDLDELLKDLLK